MVTFIANDNSNVGLDYNVVVCCVTLYKNNVNQMQFSMLPIISFFKIVPQNENKLTLNLDVLRIILLSIKKLRKKTHNLKGKEYSLLYNMVTC